MTQTYNEDVVVNNTLQVNGVTDTPQVIVKGSSVQSNSLQQWQDYAGDPLAEIDAQGYLSIGDKDATSDALIEAHNVDDLNKPSRGLHLRHVR